MSDDRTVDGVLQVLKNKRNAYDNTYQVSLFRSYVSRMGEGNIESTEILADNLEFKN